MLKSILCVLLTFGALVAFGQERCGTVEYQKLLQQKHPSHESSDQFESWVKTKMTQRLSAFQSMRVQSTNYTVPVVVHVIHNGEAVGTGTNISDDQILSQIDVLNADFNRLNADTIKTETQFKPVAGKFAVTFVLAKQDPNGLATNGIVRVQGSQTSWSISDNYALKAESYWPAENYLNIWVTNLSNGYLGYTQLPVSSTLQGLEDSSNDRITDGVVIHYRSFGTYQATGGGSFDLMSRYNLGRTATHEVGHFFGLRHVWGDCGGCSCTDYVDDTPPQNTSFNGLCPSGSQFNCTGNAMYENYMNYTDDACMNIFSQGQVARMDVIINNSPRRASLLTSTGAQLPTPIPNDLGISTIKKPGTGACGGNLSPQIVLHNYGSNTVSSAQIDLLLNGNTIETKNCNALNILPGKDSVLTFSTMVLNEGTTNDFSFKIKQTNGGADGSAINDTMSVTTVVPVSRALPLSEKFNSIPSDWTIKNPDGLIKWDIISLGSNNAMWINLNSYTNPGAYDWLITPVLDLTSASVASINFNYAYANYGNDRLRVLVSSTCDFDSAPVEIFNKAGIDLATAPATGNSFTPTSAQWNTSIISLNQFAGQKIQIAFETVNDFGNNIYVDSVVVLNSDVTAFQVSKIVSPSPVSCTSLKVPKIEVKNLGNTIIDSFTVKEYVNNQLTTQQITGAQIEIGTAKNFDLYPRIFSDGSNTLALVIKDPNGSSVDPRSKDSVQVKRYISDVADIIPLKQTFDSDFSSWTSMTPDFGVPWAAAITNQKTSMKLDAFTAGNEGTQAWLVSPILDLSNQDSASVFFDMSYGYRAPNIEKFEVYSSTDCGETFDQLLFSQDIIPNDNVDAPWIPTRPGEWTRKYINLDALKGERQARIAFVATNENGNNLYLDNIEFFTSDNQYPATAENPYSIYHDGSTIKITFNLPERQMVRVQVYDMMGQLASDEMLTDILNQTYVVGSSVRSSGLYIVSVQSQNPAMIKSTKVMLGF